jgi:hypothetical protein
MTLLLRGSVRTSSAHTARCELHRFGRVVGPAGCTQSLRQRTFTQPAEQNAPAAVKTSTTTSPPALPNSNHVGIPTTTMATKHSKAARPQAALTAFV